MLAFRCVVDIVVQGFCWPTLISLNYLVFLSENYTTMEKEVEELNKRIKAKEEIVRKLKLVKLHRVKVSFVYLITRFVKPSYIY